MFIDYVFYKKSSEKPYQNTEYIKEKLIRENYYFAIIITDAFDIIDPNSLTPISAYLIEKLNFFA